MDEVPQTRVLAADADTCQDANIFEDGNGISDVRYKIKNSREQLQDDVHCYVCLKNQKTVFDIY